MAHDAGIFPSTPLLTVNRPQIAILIGPCIPNLNAVILEKLDVARAFQIPLQVRQVVA